MKYLLSILTTIIFFSCAKKNSSYEDEIKLFQYDINRGFADASKSPLTKEDLKTFKGLAFFDIDENYKIEAEIELTPDAPVFEMKTNTERLPLYKKYGVAHFSINGKKLELNVYQEQQLATNFNSENFLFLPFNDATNGTTTYGGGRYLDLEIPKEGSKKIRIDFNKAYNPYCAYNYTFSCPIPPSENNLPIAIPVGVKAYK